MATKESLGVSAKLGHHFTRRNFIRLLGGAAVTVALGTTPTGKEIVRESGKKIVYAAAPVARRVATGTTFELLTPANNFASCKAYTNPSIYLMAEYALNLMVGFGDSITFGTDEYPKENPTSPLTHTRDLVRERDDADWDVLNLARPGSRTDQVLNDQILNPYYVQQLKRLKRPFDVWLHAGANDLRTLMDSPARAALVEELSHNPYTIDTIKNSPAFMEISRDAQRVLQNLAPSFYGILNGLVEKYRIADPKDKSYSGQLARVVVITDADSSKPERVDSSRIEGRTYQFSMDSVLARVITRAISMHINDHVALAMNVCMRVHPSLNLVAINTFDFDRSLFNGDEHPNEQGKKKIAERYLDRVVKI